MIYKYKKWWNVMRKQMIRIRSELLIQSVSFHNHQAHDISEAASLFRLIRTGDQPNSDWASSIRWPRPRWERLRKLCCFPLKTRGLEFICKKKTPQWDFSNFTSAINVVKNLSYLDEDRRIHLERFNTFCELI